MGLQAPEAKKTVLTCGMKISPDAINLVSGISSLQSTERIKLVDNLPAAICQVVASKT